MLIILIYLFFVVRVCFGIKHSYPMARRPKARLCSGGRSGHHFSQRGRILLYL